MSSNSSRSIALDSLNLLSKVRSVKGVVAQRKSLPSPSQHPQQRKQHKHTQPSTQKMNKKGIAVNGKRKKRKNGKAQQGTRGDKQTLEQTYLSVQKKLYEMKNDMKTKEGKSNMVNAPIKYSSRGNQNVVKRVKYAMTLLEKRKNKPKTHEQHLKDQQRRNSKLDVDYEEYSVFSTTSSK
eukprot:m.17685 g.17685  ORF g.17685 m.17685 type:complete len:180 (+) comp4821_c0_seq1:211-750(+)